MHDTGLWLIAFALAWLIVAAFAPKRAKWYPFGGVFRHDKRTGQLTVAVTLPGRGKSKGAKKRKR